MLEIDEDMNEERGLRGWTVSNQISFIGLRRSKDYYKRPSGVVGLCRKVYLDNSFLSGSMCAEGMDCASIRDVFHSIGDVAIP